MQRLHSLRKADHPMKRSLALFLVLLAGGIVLRTAAMRDLSWFMGSDLHVDEITYAAGDAPPWERPPGTYLAASVSDDVPTLRTVFSIISLIPALALFIFSGKTPANALWAGLLAVEPTLAFSGLQVLPSAPAAAFLALALCAMSRPALSGWLTGAAALFRGELLLLLPLSFPFIRPLKKWTLFACGLAAAVLPVMTVNALSGGPFATAENGPINLWLGTSWELLATPPGLEYEELAGGSDYAGRALDAIASSPLRWVAMGAGKTAAFLSVPGPGRNIETPVLLGETPLAWFLPVTAAALALALAGWKRDLPSAFLATGIAAAFIFFPSVRHRAVYMPAAFFMARTLRWKAAIPAAAGIAALSLLVPYPAGVRPGLTELQHGENLLVRGEYDEAMEYLSRAEARGYEGADIHSVRGACIASSGGDFQAAAREFSRALEMAPESPTAWRNMAALLWNRGMAEEARYAAEKAVSLNPALRAELAPIL